DVLRLASDVTRTERAADAARIAHETVLAACADARESLAEVDVMAEAAPAEPAPHRAGTVERTVEGQREACPAGAGEVSHLTGQPASHYILLLHELIEALTKVAVERHFLAFDELHPLWSQFDPAERHAIVTSLADLGFRFDPDEGWYGGRVPTPNDL